MRFHLLHSSDAEGMVVKFYFPKSQRYDVYVDGVFADANNGVWEEKDGERTYNLGSPDPSHVPTADGSYTAGENYFDPIDKFLYVVVTGNKVIEIKMKPVVVFKMGGSIGIDEVFN